MESTTLVVVVMPTSRTPYPVLRSGGGVRRSLPNKAGRLPSSCAGRRAKLRDLARDLASRQVTSPSSPTLTPSTRRVCLAPPALSSAAPTRVGQPSQGNISKVKGCAAFADKALRPPVSQNETITIGLRLRDGLAITEDAARFVPIFALLGSDSFSLTSPVRT